MSEQSFWFEDVPEEQRYWFLAPWGTPPRLEAEQEAEREKFGLTEQDAADLRNIEADVQHETTFGVTEQEAAETREKVAEIFKRMEAVGYGSPALEPPWWPDVRSRVHQKEREYVRAPKLYTTREQAEEDRRRLEDDAPEDLVKLVEEYEEADVNDAFDNTASNRTLWVDQDTLLDKLGDSDFLCVVVDGRLRLRDDFMEELRSAETDV